MTSLAYFSHFTHCHQQQSAFMERQVSYFFYESQIGLNIAALGALFNIHCSTASKYFVQILDIVYARTPGWIIWPSKFTIKETLPPSFKINYSETWVILDCTELKWKCPRPNKLGFSYNSYYKIPLHD